MLIFTSWLSFKIFRILPISLHSAIDTKKSQSLLTSVVVLAHIEASHRIRTHVLVSSVHASYLFKIEGRDIVSRIDAEATGLVLDSPTLAASNILRRVMRSGMGGAPASSSYADSAHIVQVTPKGVNLVEYDSLLKTITRVGTGWTPGQGSSKRSREIVAASLNASQFVVALSGGTIALLNLGMNGQLNLVK